MLTTNLFELRTTFTSYICAKFILNLLYYALECIVNVIYIVDNAYYVCKGNLHQMQRTYIIAKCLLDII